MGPFPNMFGWVRDEHSLAVDAGQVCVTATFAKRSSRSVFNLGQSLNHCNWDWSRGVEAGSHLKFIKTVLHLSFYVFLSDRTSRDVSDLVS